MDALQNYVACVIRFFRHVLPLSSSFSYEQYLLLFTNNELQIKNLDISIHVLCYVAFSLTKKTFFQYLFFTLTSSEYNSVNSFSLTF